MLHNHMYSDLKFIPIFLLKFIYLNQITTPTLLIFKMLKIIFSIIMY